MNLASIIVLAAALAGAESSAEQLIAKVLEARQTTGFRIRARLVCGQSTVDGDVQQLLIKGRRDDTGTKTLYQVLWPAATAGRAVVIEKSADHKVTGFLFEPPDKVTPVVMSQKLFGSDLTIEDVAEEFWHWPAPKIVGEEKVAGHLCQIIETRPPTNAAYSAIKVWIAPDIALPLRLEKFDQAGHLVKRFRADRLLQQEDGTWSAAQLIVEPADASRQTVLQGSRADRGLDIPAADFTPAKLKESLLNR